MKKIVITSDSRSRYNPLTKTWAKRATARFSMNGTIQAEGETIIDAVNALREKIMAELTLSGPRVEPKA